VKVSKRGSTPIASPGASKTSCDLLIPSPSVAAPSTHWTKVLFAVVATTSKIILDYVIRRLDALSAGLKPVERLNLR